MLAVFDWIRPNHHEEATAITGGAGHTITTLLFEGETRLAV